MKSVAATSTRTGALAEDFAQRYLGARGLRLVQRNFRCRCGEIDLVMRDGADLVMVEVRYRSSASLVDPVMTITRAKRQRLLRAAARYLQARPADSERNVRFDVLAVSGSLAAPRCTWYRAAFTADDT